MSVSLLEVIETAGYDINTYEDAEWLLSKESEFEELIGKAEMVRDYHIEASEVEEQQSTEEDE